jgi:hypothetical protein
MSSLVPVLQTLTWPILIGAICYWLRSDIRRAIRALAARIEQGDSIETGASGIRLGVSQPKLPGPPNASMEPSVVAYDESVPHKIYLIHAARRDPKLDKDDQEYYRLRIWIDADEPEVLLAVKSVTYHLHPSFRQPTRRIENPDNNFALATTAWGQFLVYATVEMKSDRPVLRVERYLNF